MYTFDHIYEALAFRAERFGLWDISLEILSSTRDPLLRVSMLAVRFMGANAADAPAFYEKAGLRSQASFLEDAKSHERDHHIYEALRCYLVGNNPAKAIEIGLAHIKGTTRCTCLHSSHTYPGSCNSKTIAETVIEC